MSILSKALADQTIGNPNLIIDGNFDYWIEGTSQTSSGYGSSTMWISYHAGDTTKTITREDFTHGQTSVPGNPSYFTRTVFDGGSTADSRLLLEQKQDLLLTKLSGKTITVSFYAKADTALELGTDVYQMFGSGGSASVPSGNKVFTLSTSWKKYTTTINVPSINGKTLGSDYAFQFRFWMSAGADISSEAGIGIQSGTIDIARVKLEEGHVATNGGWRTVDEELKFINRYFVVKAVGRYIPPAKVDDISAKAAWRDYIIYTWEGTMRALPTPTVALGNLGSNVIYASGSGGYVAVYNNGSVLNEITNQSVIHIDARL